MIMTREEKFMMEAIALSKKGIEIMRKQNFGGDIVNVVSKNSIVAGPNNAGYGSAKAAQAHLTRLLAAELGADKIRVNTGGKFSWE